MAGTLKDVGTGLLTPETFRKILKNKKRSLAGITAPAKGLTLKKVSYT